MNARILVVDDEPDLEALILQKFRHQIRDGSVSFLFARDGIEALAALKANGGIDLYWGEDWQVYFDERAGIVEFDGGLPRAEAEAQAYVHAGAGGGCGRSSAIRRKISWNICRGTATSAIGKAI
jgi:CheY-like chemotaxis protein